MKILRVAGTNLASLDEFDIDFRKVTGERNRIFAIIGDTGAGKSTILDAVCLALYGRTPRISKYGANSGAVELEDGHSVGMNDSINVMTRGKNNCMAVVDFEGRGGVYRACFSVGKKRTKFSYKFEVRRLGENGEPGDLLEDRDKAYSSRPLYDYIQPYTGLTWEQFKKVIVLPQGEFAAFLEDDAKAKSGLLEKLTGTEIYQKIDEVVSGRISGIRAATEDCRRQMDVLTQKLLTDDDRKSITDRLGSCTSELTKTVERIRILNDFAKYGAELAKVKADISGLTAQKQRLETGKEDFKEDYRIRDLFELSRPLREIRINLDNAGRNLKALKTAGAGLAESRAKLEEELRAAGENLNKRKVRYDECKKEKELKAHVLESAESLEKEKGTLKAIMDAGTKDIAEKKVLLVNRKAESAKAEKERNDVLAGIRALEESHEKNSKYEFMKDAWPELRVRMADYRNFSGQLREKESSAQNHLLEMNKKQSEWKDSFTQYLNLTKDSGTYSFAEGKIPEQGMYDDALKDIGTFGKLHGLAERNLTTLKYQTDKYITAAEKIRKDYGAFSDACRQLDGLNSGNGLTVLKKRKDELTGVIQTCKVAIELHGYAVNLKPGEPCPCCGSTVHPRLEGESNGPDTLLENLSADRNKYESELKAVEAEIGRLEKQLIELRENVKSAVSGIRLSAGELRSADADIRSFVLQLNGYCKDMSVLADSDYGSNVSCLNDLRVIFRETGAEGLAFTSSCDERMSPLTGAVESLAGLLSDDRYESPEEKNTSLRFPEEMLASFKEYAEGIAELRDFMGRKADGAAVMGESLNNARKIIGDIKNIHDKYVYIGKAYDEDSAQAVRLKEKVSGLVFSSDDDRLTNAWNAMIEVADEEKFKSCVERYNEIVRALNSYARDRGVLDTALAVKNTAVESGRRNEEEAGSELQKAQDGLSDNSRKYDALTLKLNELTGGISVAALREKIQHDIDVAGGEKQKAEIACRNAESLLESCKTQQKNNEAEVIRTEKEAAALKEKLDAEALKLASGEGNVGGFSHEDVVAGAGIDETVYQDAVNRVSGLEAEILKTEKDLTSRKAVLGDVERRLQETGTKMAPEDFTEDGSGIREDVYAEAEENRKRLEEEKSECEGRLRNDKNNLAELENLRMQTETIRNANKSLYELKELFDLKRSFKEYAQKITFGYLVNKSNRYILDFTSGRYELRQVSAKAKSDQDHEVNHLEMVVIDHDRGDTGRLVNSLSGGEKFRVALGLALGLSDLIVRNVRVDNMFIDEGFDTLDNERLDSLLNSLSSVTNRQIGIITHVDQVVNGGMIQSRILVRHRDGDSSRSEVVVL